MFKGLTLFKVASALAQHAAARQVLTARNVANSETPGYRAADLPDFAETLRAGAEGAALKRTRPGHLAPAATPVMARAVAASGEGDMSPDGNDVSLETEMVRAAEVRQQHELALSVYRSGLEQMRTALGRAK